MGTPPSFVDGDCGDMNASLWNELQSFIDLSMIYAKLLLAPFFRLRQVCKEWNHLASNRQFLEQNFKPPISSNPYFVITRLVENPFLLTSDGSLWNCMPLPQVRCEVSGLIFEYSNRNRVFDLHTRVFHTLPPFSMTRQERECDFNEYSLIGMTVDTTSIPYKFRVIIAIEFLGTKVYDSNSGAWTHSPSITYSAMLSTSCVQYNKSLYVRVGSFYECSFETYDLERKKWNLQKLQLPYNMHKPSDIGVWQDRWYVFAEDYRSGLQVLECKYEPNLNEPWNLFDSAFKDLYDWIKDPEHSLFFSKFCGEHMLVYKYTRAMKRALLYNLDQRTWDKIEL